MPDRRPCCRLCLSNDDVSLLGWSLQHAAQHRSCQGPYLRHKHKHKVCILCSSEVHCELWKSVRLLMICGAGSMTAKYMFTQISAAQHALSLHQSWSNRTFGTNPKPSHVVRAFLLFL